MYLDKDDAFILEAAHLKLQYVHWEYSHMYALHKAYSSETCDEPLWYVAAGDK